MKKNLISIIILALLIVNVVLTAIMMFSVTSTSKKTAALVDNISTALNLELAAKGTDSEEAAEEIPMSDIQTYDISESMTIPLKTDEDGEPHFCMVSVTLSMNTKDKGFKTYGADLSGQESLIKSEIIDVFGQYTLSEARDHQDEIRQEILQRVQKMFDSEFIFNISFSNILFQ
jgi:flagellar basal body-associated protein FliL